MSFTHRHFDIAPGAAGTRHVVLSTIVSADDARALGVALARQRSREFLAPAAEHADDVLALRSLVALVDQMETIGATAHGGPVTFQEGQIALLAEATAMYLSEQDGDGFQEQAARSRNERLRALNGPLFDLVSHFSAAAAEAAEQGRLHAP
jgi:hypothetical protein